MDLYAVKPVRKFEVWDGTDRQTDKVGYRSARKADSPLKILDSSIFELERHAAPQKNC